jgi:Uma2 family endonuclease
MSIAALPIGVETADRSVLHPLWRISVDRYHRMIQTGVLTADDQVELLDGLLVAKMNKSPRHCAAGRMVRLALEAVVPGGWFVDTQDPITLADSEPEPDVSVTIANRGELLDRHPGPDELGLVVEISDTSLARDRDAKRRIYALAGVPVYWIVNLVDERVEVYSAPEHRTGYARRNDYRMGDTVPVILGGQEVGHIPVAALLPG